MRARILSCRHDITRIIRVIKKVSLSMLTTSFGSQNDRYCDLGSGEIIPLLSSLKPSVELVRAIAAHSLLQRNERLITILARNNNLKREMTESYYNGAVGRRIEMNSFFSSVPVSLLQK